MASRPDNKQMITYDIKAHTNAKRFFFVKHNPKLFTIGNHEFAYKTIILKNVEVRISAENNGLWPSVQCLN